MKGKKLVFLLTVFCILSIIAAGCQGPTRREPGREEGQIEDDIGDQVDREGQGEEEREEDRVGDREEGEEKFPDGNHKAELDPDERGWKSRIEITVEDGKITEVDYDEVNEEGKRKSEDEDYGKSMEDASGISPAEAYKRLEESLVSTQSIDEVESVTGATGSYEAFKEVAEKALK